MSTPTTNKSPSSSTHTAPTPAPWRPLFLTHLSHLPSPEFVLSSLSRAPDAAHAVPRARYCIYRGMFGEIPYSTHYDATTYGKNEASYESDMLTLTTDARMEKTSQILDGDGDGVPAGGSGLNSGGGGGPVEAVFWIREVMTQWRFKAKAYILGPNIEKIHNLNLKTKLLRNMRCISPYSPSSSDKKWSWEQEVHSHFGNLSPAMRGSFLNPAPGTAVGKPVMAGSDVPATSTISTLKLGQKITTSLFAGENVLARKHFRVVVLLVDEVEQLDIGESKRWRWRLKRKSEGEGEGGGGEGGEWIVEELWP